MGSYERKDLIDDISAVLRTADEERLLEIHRMLCGGESTLKVASDNLTKVFKRFHETLDALEKKGDKP